MTSRSHTNYARFVRRFLTGRANVEATSHTGTSPRQLTAMSENSQLTIFVISWTAPKTLESPTVEKRSKRTRVRRGRRFTATRLRKPFPLQVKIWNRLASQQVGTRNHAETQSVGDGFLGFDRCQCTTPNFNVSVRPTRCIVIILLNTVTPHRRFIF